MEERDLPAVCRMETALFGAEAWSPSLLGAELAAATGPHADRGYGVLERVRGGRGRGARARTPFSLFPPWEGEKLMGAEGRREGDTGPLSPGRPDRGNSRRLIIVIDM